MKYNFSKIIIIIISQCIWRKAFFISIPIFIVRILNNTTKSHCNIPLDMIIFHLALYSNYILLENIICRNNFITKGVTGIEVHKTYTLMLVNCSFPHFGWKSFLISSKFTQDEEVRRNVWMLTEYL